MHPLKKYWLTFLKASDETTRDHWWTRKKALFKKRKADIVKVNGNGQLYERINTDDNQVYRYKMHISFLIKQHDAFYIEEHVVPYEFQLRHGQVEKHQQVFSREKQTEEPFKLTLTKDDKLRFDYDRLAAVQYAERWWNDYNPEFETFTVDCTNYISQCLYAGGAPMRGAPDRSAGWWYQSGQWSYSWSVAHSLRWYLSGSTTGLVGREVESAGDLSPGDVICYDFEGDGRYDHTTIVVSKDAEGMPLVNAHTDNSRHRYWSYEDSTAWTPNMQYKFFQIGEK